MKIINKNKKAYYNYKILKTFEAGIILTGPEVKSIKQGNINFSDSYVDIGPTNSLWLINIHVSRYAPAFSVQQNYDPSRKRKLLLNKKEIKELIGKIKSPGTSVIPLKTYLKGGIIKITIGIGIGKKQTDKRAIIKKRELDKKIRREMKY
ncbi:SsrA-binding protein SmpB [Patescibacteria group bacterium]|nr:SsrA-binding protein SmpB [Patescibacteria group bacterium]